MRKIYTPVILLSFLLLLLSCTFKHPKEKEAVCVTYHVLVRDIYPHKLLISYRDAGRLVTFYCTEKRWSKKVSLSPDDIASLFVSDIFDPDKPFAFVIEKTEEEKRWLGEPIAVRIEHEKKVILKAGSKFLQVNLLQSEMDSN